VGDPGRAMMPDRAVMLVVVAGVLACQSQDKATDTWTVRDYMQAGVPDPGHAWSSSELKAAVAAIAVHSDHLPSFEGSHSGAVFARVVAAAPDDPTATVKARMNDLMAREDALRAFAKLYLGGDRDVPRREPIEAWGTMLDIDVTLEPLMQTFLASFPPDAPSLGKRKEGLRKMRGGEGEMIRGMLTMASDTRADLAVRRAIVGHATHAVAGLFSSFGASDQLEIRGSLAKLVDGSSGALHDDAVAMQHALPAVR
jgi:hypothetical protein